MDVDGNFGAVEANIRQGAECALLGGTGQHGFELVLGHADKARVIEWRGHDISFSVWIYCCGAIGSM